MKKVYAVAFCIMDTDNNYLFCKRSIELDEYKNFWSLPSSSISKDEYDNIQQLGFISSELASSISLKKLGTIVSNGKLLHQVERHRGDYLLNICLCEVITKGDLKINAKVYTDAIFLHPTKLLKLSDNYVGTCISMLIQNLIKNEKISRLINYIELPPQIADSGKHLDSYSDIELWQISMLNYYLYLQKIQDGTLLKKAILDEFFDSYFKLNIKKTHAVLDVGCGLGDLLLSASRLTEDYWGLELSENIFQLDVKVSEEKIKIGDLSTAIELFPGKKFDVIILNLVIQWIDELDKVVELLKRLLNDGGKVIITGTTHFLKFGEFEKTNNNEYVFVVNQPFRVKSLMTMISRNSGPFRMYPRQPFEILNMFANFGFTYLYSEDLYLNSYLNHEEVAKIINIEPATSRHLDIPLFNVLIFTKI